MHITDTTKIKCALCRKHVDVVERHEDCGQQGYTLKFKVTCHGETEYSELELHNFRDKNFRIVEAVAFATPMLPNKKKEHLTIAAERP